jgi:hypothetical protein
MQSKECMDCGLYLQSISNPCPPESLLAWKLWNMLSNPAVQRFGLHSEIFELFDLKLTEREFVNLLDELNQVESAVRSVAEVVAARKGKK